MANTSIQFDRANQFGQEIRAYLTAIRKVNDDGPKIIEAIVHMVDGDGSAAAHFAPLVTLGIYPTNEMAQASYNELASVNAKLTTDGSVTAVDAAMKQVCAKHGII